MPEPIVDSAGGQPQPAFSLHTTPEMFDHDRFVPAYNQSEVARCFFGRSPSWLRKHQMLHHTLLPGESGGPGELVEPLRNPSTGRPAWRLYDIERLAHALAAHRVITGRELELAVTMVTTSAKIYSYLS